MATLRLSALSRALSDQLIDDVRAEPRARFQRTGGDDAAEGSRRDEHLEHLPPQRGIRAVFHDVPLTFTFRKVGGIREQRLHPIPR